MELTDRQVANFWAKVSKSGPDDCWPWIGGIVCSSGYGWYGVGQRQVGATRVALALDGRPRPSEREYALHSCDNRLCVNPRHLRWGTHGDNMADAFERGKALNSCNFSDEQVREIRRASGTCKALGEAYHCSAATISQIKNRRMYACVS